MIFINDIIFERKEYPAGEQILEFDEQIMNSLKENDLQKILWNYKDDKEFMTIWSIKNKLTELGYKRVELIVPYFPYARMDRIKKDSQFLSLQYVADFINSLNFKKVTVYDAHSDELLKMVHNVKNESKIDLLVTEVCLEQGLNLEDVVVVFPDKTSVKRYKHLKQLCFSWLEVEKTRDFDTGKITGFKLIEPESKPDISERTLVIVDDICSYGGTFIGAIEEIKKHHEVKDFILCVTHLEKAFYDGMLKEHPNLISVKHANTLDY